MLLHITDTFPRNETQTSVTIHILLFLSIEAWHLIIVFTFPAGLFHRAGNLELAIREILYNNKGDS